MIDPEIQRYNTPGFSGCLSGVKFNSLVPLKAIFRPTSVVRPYSIRGELVESSCASMLPLTTILIPPEMDPWYMGTGRCSGGTPVGREPPGKHQLQRGRSSTRPPCSPVSGARSVSAEFPHVHDDGWMGIIIGCK